MMKEFKLVFACLGFSSNPCFVLPDKGYPIAYGWVINYCGDYSFEKDKNCDLFTFSDEEVLKEYNKQLEKRGVCINNLSKEAWLGNQYGESLKKEHIDGN
jgi:hypothetical protein